MKTIHVNLTNSVVTPRLESTALKPDYHSLSEINCSGELAEVELISSLRSISRSRGIYSWLAVKHCPCDIKVYNNVLVQIANLRFKALYLGK